MQKSNCQLIQHSSCTRDILHIELAGMQDLSSRGDNLCSTCCDLSPCKCQCFRFTAIHTRRTAGIECGEWLYMSSRLRRNPSSRVILTSHLIQEKAMKACHGRCVLLCTLCRSPSTSNPRLMAQPDRMNPEGPKLLSHNIAQLKKVKSLAHPILLLHKHSLG